MWKHAKWVALVFVLWFMIAQPHKSADAVKQLENGLSSAAKSLSTFIAGLP